MGKSWEGTGDLLSPSFLHLSKPELSIKPFSPIYLFIPIPGKEITLLMQTLNTLSTSEEKLAALCKKYAELVSPGAGGGRGSSGRQERALRGTFQGYTGALWCPGISAALDRRGWALLGPAWCCL